MLIDEPNYAHLSTHRADGSPRNWVVGVAREGDNVLVCTNAEAARVTGLGQGLSGGLARWRAPRAVHDPGKIIADLVVTLALGGDCLADIKASKGPAARRAVDPRRPATS